MAKKNYYAVAVGRKSGIYHHWYGADGAEAQVKGYPNAVFRGFALRNEAVNFLEKHRDLQSDTQLTFESSSTDISYPKAVHKKPTRSERVVIYTDGGCRRNPGPGGYGVVVKKGKKKKELSGGFRLTTNNRMELLGCIVGLSQLKNPSKVTLYSDSKYVVYGIDKGWAKRWRANNWMRTKEEPAINPDLWDQLLNLCNKHEVKFIWVKGHAGNPENERCDQLATQAASRRNLPTDRVYEAKQYERYVSE